MARKRVDTTDVKGILSKPMETWTDEERALLQRAARQRPVDGWPRQIERGQEFEAFGVEAVVESVSVDRLVLVRKGYQRKPRGSDDGKAEA